MKQSPLVLLTLGLSALAVSSFAPKALAASAASDNATNYTSTSTAWTTGSNLGNGFGAWNLFGSNNGNSNNFYGNYLGGTGLGSNNFGIYSGPAGSGASFDAQRPLTGALSAGQTFSVDLGHTSVDSAGSVGINFQSVTGNGVANVFSLISSNGTWYLNDGGNNFGVGTSADNTAYHFTLTYNGGSSYSFTLTNSGGGNNYIASADISNINQIQFFDYQQGSGGNFGFDNLAVGVPEPATSLGGAGIVLSGVLAFRRSRKARQA